MSTKVMCPYCEEELSETVTFYYCTNPECPAIDITEYISYKEK